MSILRNRVYFLLWIVTIIVTIFVIIGHKQVKEKESTIVQSSYTLSKQFKNKIEGYGAIRTKTRLQSIILIAYDVLVTITESRIRAQINILKRNTKEKSCSRLLAIKDPFSTATLREHHNIIYSLGPDGVDNLAMVIYDPTNGTFSVGDIIIKARVANY